MSDVDNYVSVVEDARFPKSILGYQNLIEFDQLCIEHDGSATWMELQTVKNIVWGEGVLGVEVYPPQETVVNGNSTEFHYRHIWRFPVWMAWPNMRKEGTF